MNTSIANILAEDEAGKLTDEQFDEALWLALCERVHRVEDLRMLSVPARIYFASRYVELEVGNGGFAQAVLNVPEYLEPAAEAFEVLGKPQVSARIRAASALYEREIGSLPEVRPGNEPVLSVYFLDNAFNHLDEGLNELDFWSDVERLAYIRAHREGFSDAA